MPKRKIILHLIGNNTVPSKYPTASEYIKPLGQINITSHGLGSGVYGLSTFKYDSIKDNLPTYLSKRRRYQITIKNPFIINSNELCDKLIHWSTQLNNTLEKYKTKFISGKLGLRLLASIYTEQFNMFSTKKLTQKKFIKALKKFLRDYTNRTDFVCMPINYIFRELRYDGIYAEKSACDSMNKGNIKFMWYPTARTKKILTNVIKIRTGTNVKKIVLPNYMLVKGVLLKHPPKFTPEYEQWKKDHGIVPFRAKKRISKK